MTRESVSSPAFKLDALPTDARRIRVALVGDYPIAEDAIHEGGVQSVTFALAHALARRSDVECHVVCSTRGAATHYRRVGELHVHYTTRLPLPRLATCRIHDVPRLVSVIRAIRPDIVHGQGQDRHSLAALRAGVPSVVTPHGVFFIESRMLQRHRFDLVGMLKKRLVNGMEEEVFRRASDMVIISRYLPEIYGPMLTAHSHFIENPINEEYFYVPRAPEPGRLLFVGTVVPRKCVHDLVRAVALVVHAPAPPGAAAPSWKAKLQLRIAGPVLDPGSKALIQRTIEETDVAAHVTFCGALSQSELLNEYGRAQALLLASREETTPQVIAQAMACGLPTISSAVGGVPDMISDGTTGLLFPFGDARACADQISRLHDAGSLREAITLRIRGEARQRFHPDSVATQTVAVYREALARVRSLRDAHERFDSKRPRK
jgi:glycosyltransferase involved in cell wall biosynthesis